MIEITGAMGQPVRPHSPSERDMVVNDALHEPMSCGVNLVYCDEYDAFYCPSCDVWTEGVCGDRDCPYCPGRPDHPSEAHPISGAPLDAR